MFIGLGGEASALNQNFSDFSERFSISCRGVRQTTALEVIPNLSLENPDVLGVS